MPQDEVLPPPQDAGLCPEPLIMSQSKLGQVGATWGAPCIMEKCGKYQACKVLPKTMEAVLQKLTLLLVSSCDQEARLEEIRDR